MDRRLLVIRSEQGHYRVLSSTRQIHNQEGPMAITPLGQLSRKNEDDADYHIKGRQGDDSEPRKYLGMREVEGDEEGPPVPSTEEGEV